MEWSNRIQLPDMELGIFSEMERTHTGQSFDNIFGVEKCSDMLIENIVQPFRFPHLYTKPVRAFSLFGVPGCGKSHLLSAAAHASGAKLLVFNVWKLPSRRVEGAYSADDLLKAVFKVARDNSPSILCFEDFEVFSRDDMSAAKMSFISEMENFIQSPQDIWDLVVIIGVTQAPWKVDSSIRGTLEWSPASHVPLPNADARMRGLEHSCKDLSHCLSHEQFRILASRTTGFTGSDLICLTRSASFGPVKELKAATHFKKVAVEPNSGIQTKPASVNPVRGTEKQGDIPSQPADPKQCSERIATKTLDSCKNNKPANTEIRNNEQESSSENPDPHKKDGDCASAETGNSLAASCDERFQPCSAEDPGAIPVSVFDLPPYKIVVSKVTMEHMEEELQKMKPTVNSSDLEKMALFESEHCVA